MPAVVRRPLLERIGLRGGRPNVDRSGLSLTASAAVVNLQDRSEAGRLSSRQARQAWQEDAWTYRDSIGEVRYVQDWLGVAVSRMRLYPAVIVRDVDEPVSLEEALAPEGTGVDPVRLPPALIADLREALDALGDVGALLDRATVNLECVGEFYLVGYFDQLGRERWDVRSLDELEQTDAGWLLRDRPGKGSSMSSGQVATTKDGGPLLDPADSYVARVWRSHKRWTGLADSPMRAVLDRCEELLLLGRKVRAGARSRLSAGIYKISTDLDFEDSIDPVTQEVVPAEPFEDVLMRHMVAPISDETAASAVAPLIVKGPTEALAAMGLDNLGRASDPEDRAEREEALSRVLRGLDAPEEVVTGFADVKYANARAIGDDSFRYNVEPKVLTLVHAITTAYLRPRLLALRHDPALVDTLCVWYDPSGLVTNPDQGKDAQEVYDAGELSGDALRRYRGFDDADAPTDEERARYLLLRGKPSAPALPSSTPAPDPANPPEPDPSDTPPAVEPAGTRAITASAQVASTLGTRLLRLDDRLLTRLQAASDAAMARALERAGGRARSKARSAGQNVEAVPNADLPSQLDLEALGLSSTGLLGEDPFADLAAAFTGLAERTFEAALRATAGTLGLRYWTPEETSDGLTAAAPPPFSDLGGLDFVDLRERAARDRRQAADRLRRTLTELALERLHTPHPDAPADGEHDPQTTVPPGVLRAAMARAGGADSSPTSAGVTDLGQPVDASGGLPGGIATGMSLREASARAGLQAFAYVWSHGGAGRPFEPHLELDGQTFSTQADPRLLKAPTSWPRGTTSYYPGDHPGCTCWTEYLYPDPFAGLSAAEARQVRASQRARDERGRFVGRRDHPDDTPGDLTTPRTQS